MRTRDGRLLLGFQVKRCWQPCGSERRESERGEERKSDNEKNRECRKRECVGVVGRVETESV